MDEAFRERPDGLTATRAVMDTATAGRASAARRDAPVRCSSQGAPMPRFAANLAYLFTERPLPERVGAAAAAGFGAIEFQMPYDHAPSVMKAEIDRHGVAVLGLNTGSGRPGEFGLAA